MSTEEKPFDQEMEEAARALLKEVKDDGNDITDKTSAFKVLTVYYGIRQKGIVPADSDEDDDDSVTMGSLQKSLKASNGAERVQDS